MVECSTTGKLGQDQDRDKAGWTRYHWDDFLDLLRQFISLHILEVLLGNMTFYSVFTFFPWVELQHLIDRSASISLADFISILESGLFGLHKLSNHQFCLNARINRLWFHVHRIETLVMSVEMMAVMGCVEKKTYIALKFPWLNGSVSNSYMSYGLGVDMPWTLFRWCHNISSEEKTIGYRGIWDSVGHLDVWCMEKCAVKCVFSMQLDLCTVSASQRPEAPFSKCTQGIASAWL